MLFCLYQYPVWPFSSSLPKCQGLPSFLYGQAIRSVVQLLFDVLCYVDAASSVGGVRAVDI
jgi:hypothetical protein